MKSENKQDKPGFWWLRTIIKMLGTTLLVQTLVACGGGGGNNAVTPPPPQPPPPLEWGQGSWDQTNWG